MFSIGHWLCCCALSVRPACYAVADAGQVPAGLRLHTPRQDIPHPHLHRHSDRLFRGHVGHQEPLVHVHHIPAYGKLNTRQTPSRLVSKRLHNTINSRTHVQKKTYKL